MVNTLPTKINKILNELNPKLNKISYPLGHLILIIKNPTQQQKNELIIKIFKIR
jgi:hypothetical protein